MRFNAIFMVLIGLLQQCTAFFDCRSGSQCTNYASCSPETGGCESCPQGFGGDDCSTALCGSLFGDKDRAPLPSTSSACKCNRGWSGLNCNVCDDDAACYGPFGPGDSRTLCERSGLMAKQHFRSCAVKLPDFYAKMLGNRPTSATFQCDNVNFDSGKLRHATFDCQMQFWLKTVEQFYCKLGGCTKKPSDHLQYGCTAIVCSCIAGRELCSAKRLIDLSPVLQQVGGACSITCTKDGACMLWEHMLADFFDGGVVMNCASGECMSSEWIPALLSSVIPVVKILTIAAFSLMSLTALVFLGLVLYLLLLNHCIMNEKSLNLDPFCDDSENGGEEAKLAFENIRFTVQNNSITVLDGIYGIVEPGKILGIIGGSGSGKTTLLDILACKAKKGCILGEIFINDRRVTRRELKRIYGFVEQDDVLMGSLTVKETLIYTAFLRLPAAMSMEQKQARVFQTLRDLGIEHLADRFVGIPGQRGISGGEKRRLVIAQELITRPRILFLDEPTSGLDSFTALALVRSLFKLARRYNTTIVMTLHQPRSNIFHLLDYVILLGHGRQLYFGSSSGAHEYFNGIGYSCPEGYNIGDYMLDVAATSVDPNPLGDVGAQYKHHITNSTTSLEEDQSSGYGIQHRTLELYQKFRDSENFQNLTADLANISLVPGEGEQRYEQVNSFSRFCILSCRTLTNIIRNPYLLASHWAVSAIIGMFCGLLFWHVTNDMAGVQNRLGCLFFTCAFFAFSSMTSLEFFSTEKALFLRERANGFYGAFAFYFSKVLFDIFPLRIIPPLLYGCIIYRMTGFYAAWANFFKFLFSLVMFNLASSSICLLIGIAISPLSVGNLVASILILLSMLFGGFLMNKEKVLPLFKWIKYLSIFNYAYEAMIVNELVHVVLSDKSMVDVRIPGSIILRQFGFNTSGYNFDLCMLGVIFYIAIVSGYLVLHIFVREIK